MTSAVSIRQAHADIACVDAALGNRIATSQRSVLDAAASAIDRSVASDRELVFVRSVEVPVRFGAEHGDRVAREAWSAAVADAVLRTVEAEIDVVRYPSTQHVAADIAEAVGTGDLRRAWAWSMSEVAPGAASTAEFCDALVTWLREHPESIVPVLQQLARRGRIDAVFAELGPDRFASLAAFCRAPVGGVSVAASPGPAGLADLPTGQGTGLVRRHPVWGSPLVVAARRAVHRVPADVASSWVAFVARAMRPMGTLRQQLIADVWTALHVGVGNQVLAPAAERPRLESADPRSRRPDPGQLVNDGQYSMRYSAASRAGDPSDQLTAVGHPPADLATESEERLPGPIRYDTDAGGLLYLLNVINDDTLLGAVLATIAGRPTAEALFHTAARLTGDSTDPVVAVFAGLHPEDAADAVDPPTADETEVLERLADTLADAVAVHLRSDLDSAVALQRVIRRRARLLVVDGWCDAEFGLEDIDVDIRLAGLDRDPGFVALTGTVVRFHYV